MKQGYFVLTVLILVFAAAAMAADDPLVGTWKLKTSRTNIAQNETVRVQAAVNGFEFTHDRVTGNGRQIHTNWTGTLDGKEHPVAGDPSADKGSLRRISANSLEITLRKAGKVVSTATLVISADGRTSTVTIKQKDPKGSDITAVQVYEKQ